MFETGVRQLRMALSMVTGRRISPRNVERLIGDALATLETFGAPGDEVGEMLAGPFADPQARRSIQEQALRRTARRLAQRSPFYRARFAELGFDPKGLSLDAMSDLPVTTKQDLVTRQAEFIVDGARPFIATRTTGTTGPPVEVWLSRYEVELWSALAALSGLLRGELGPGDCVQINLSSRATASVHLNVAVCRLAGARSRVLGILPADESIDGLLTGGEDAPTVLSTYPSYLAQLVRAARRRGLGPADFRLRRIDCGGEVLSSGLVRAASEMFGAEINDVFGMTEALPVSGRVCEHGHLHHDLNMGFVEVIALDSGRPCAAGAVGTVVITPYYPYRECMPVFRYDTRDLVRKLDDADLTCSLAGMPATTRILGKAGDVVHVGQRAVTPRDLVEAFESLPGEPWPARFAVAGSPSGRLEVRLSQDTAGHLSADEVGALLATTAGDLPILCSVVDGEAATRLRRVRADLLEHTFSRQEA